MSRFREAGLEFVGMSSVGPSIAIITEKDRAAVEGIVRDLGLSITVETMVDNKGLKSPIPVEKIDRSWTVTRNHHSTFLFFSFLDLSSPCTDASTITMIVARVKARMIRMIRPMCSLIQGTDPSRYPAPVTATDQHRAERTL